MTASLAPDWEYWFSNFQIQEVEQKVKNLEKEVAKDSQQVRETIGRSHDDIMTLIDRISYARQLSKEQQTRTADFLQSPIPEVSSAKIPNAFDSMDLDLMISQELSSIAGHNIMCRKYSMAARCLHIAEVLGLKSERLEIQRENLENKLLNWIRVGISVNTDIFHACLIVFKLNTNDFFTKYLEIKTQYVKDQLHSLKTCQAVFAIVDQTVFVYNRILADISNVELSKRKVADIFGPRRISQLLKFKENELQSCQMFPEECYVSNAEDRQTPLQQFVENVCKMLNHLVSNSGEEIQRLEELVDLGMVFVKEAQKSLHGGSNMSLLLMACVDPFATKFTNLFEAEIATEPLISTSLVSNWIKAVQSTDSQISHLSWLSEATSSLAKPFSVKVKDLEEKSRLSWRSVVHSTYKKQRGNCLQIETAELVETTKVVEAVTLLDSAISQLGLASEPLPSVLYEKLATQIMAVWTAEQSTLQSDDQDKPNQDDQTPQNETQTNETEAENQNAADTNPSSSSTEGNSVQTPNDQEEGGDSTSTAQDTESRHREQMRSWFGFMRVLDANLPREFWSDDLITALRNKIELYDVSPSSSLLFAPLV